MGNLNKVMLIGRLTRDPDVKVFQSGGKVANIGFAVNNKKKVDGKWENVPVWLEVKAFSAADKGRKLADLAEKYLTKGKQIFIEGHLATEQWEDKETGKKRQKTVIIADSIEFLEKKSDAGAGSSSQSQQQGGGQSEEDLEEVPF